MTYSEYHATFTNKAKRYPADACRFAISDCHETLKIQGKDISTDYSTRLLAEIDAMRERLAYLTKHN